MACGKSVLCLVFLIPILMYCDSRSLCDDESLDCGGALDPSWNETKTRDFLWTTFVTCNTTLDTVDRQRDDLGKVGDPCAFLVPPTWAFSKTLPLGVLQGLLEWCTAGLQCYACSFPDLPVFQNVTCIQDGPEATDSGDSN